MICIVLPIVAHLPGKDGGGVHESAVDAVHIATSSWQVAALVSSYWLSIAFYNFAGLAVAKSLSSVHRCLIDACRTILVWCVDLLLYYSTKRFGEPWDPKASPIQLLGFCVLLFGTFTYYKVIRLPCCTYAEEREEQSLQNDFISRGKYGALYDALLEQ